MAHKSGLDGTYLQPTREECFTEFLKAVPGLTVDPTEKQKFEIHNLKLEKSELEKVTEDNAEIRKKFLEFKEEANIIIDWIEKQKTRKSEICTTY